MQELPTAAKEGYLRRATLLMQSQGHPQVAVGHPSVGRTAVQVERLVQMMFFNTGPLSQAQRKEADPVIQQDLAKLIQHAVRFHPHRQD